MYRKTWMEIDLDAIASNVRFIKEYSGKKLIAVLKADAYGCGDIQIANTVIEAGADMIAVSSIDEALMLRNEGYQGNILILGCTYKEDVPLLIEQRISVTAFSEQWVEDICSTHCQNLKIHLKVETGMNRIGFQNQEDLIHAKEMLLKNGCILEGIFTHFACADTSPQMTNAQFERFQDTYMALNYPFEWIHCDNSDATLSFSEQLSNACRVGISLYGISSVTNKLTPALSLYSSIFMLKTVKPNQTIGYGATYTTKENEIIATIPIGYADGLTRANQNRHVYVDGNNAQIVGRICMDQTLLKLKYPVPIGTIVEIFGKHISLEEMAKDLNTIPYEIICLISGRVTRVYRKNGIIAFETNERLIKSTL